MHDSVRIYIKQKQCQYPLLFQNRNVVDFGAFDINGNNRAWFLASNYLGVDILKGRNVDIVGKTHEVELPEPFDFVISTEMLEHDKYFDKSIQRMFSILKSNGVLLITAAGYGRKEHGTSANSPNDSLLTNDYYKNITAKDLIDNLPLDEFRYYEISYINKDIRFFGIKQ